MSKRTLWAALVAVALLLGSCVVVQPERTGEDLSTEHDDGASQEQIFQVVTATYLLDGVDLHGIDESINDEGVIEPEYAGAVQRIRRVLAVTDWPEELHEGASALLATLDTLAGALADDDADAAGPLATAAHEQQHDLSHAVEDWLAEQGIGAESGEHSD